MLEVKCPFMESGIPIPDFSADMCMTEADQPERSATPQCQLPNSDTFCGNHRTITPRELAQLINNPSSGGYSRLIILDARFDYEYRGGRITGAINVNTRKQLINVYDRFRGQNVCVVIHCEFSQNRGPSLYQLFREHDRRCNPYPHLSYPNVFLLEGGYRRFYQEMPAFCIGGYTPMRDEKYVISGDLKRSHSFFKKEILQQNKAIKPRPTIQRCSSQICQGFPLLFDGPLSKSSCDDEALTFPLCASQGSF